MFDYPIPPLSHGLYNELGVGPEATAEEISEARQELTVHLRARQKAAQRVLEDVYQEVPQLRETREELKSLEVQGAEADPAKFRNVQLRLTELEEKALTIRSDYKAVRDEAAVVERRLNEVNLMPIQNPEQRLEYDRSHPPLELIKLSDCTTTPLDDPKVALRMVREQLSDFFKQSNEEVFHPSDLTRNDFRCDFTPDANLDRKA